ncbi:MAG: TIGR00282 family metallophosphoesterase [Alphaproteobacteria bacterium]
MRILFCGDVVGRSGREAVLRHIPEVREKLKLDLVVVNAENAAGGFGITERLCEEFYDAGVDVLTLGNHAWAQREIVGYIDQDPKLLRPLNYPETTPGLGSGLYPTASGERALVVQVMGRLFMEPLDDPFAAIEKVLANHRLGSTVGAIIVDIHAEATSEKMAMGHHLDGRVSMVAGTHTHVPTADAQVLPKGTAYISDVGMCGDYDSVIGMKKETSIKRFLRPIRTEPFSPAEGEATLCGLYVETDPKTGLATYAAPLRLGGRLAPAWPLEEG